MTVSPYISAAQKRIESWERAKMPWDYTLYEPKPLSSNYSKSRSARRFWLIFYALAICAVIGGAMWGLSVNV